MPKRLAINEFFAIFLFILLGQFFLIFATPFNLFSPSGLTYLLTQLCFALITSSLLELIKIKKIKWSLFIILSLFYLFNLEHIYVNNSHLNFGHIKFLFNKTFFSSIWNIQFFKNLLYILTLLFVSLSISFTVTYKIKKKALFIILISSTILEFIIPRSVALANWQVHNPLSFYVSKIFINNSFSLEKREILNKRKKELQAPSLLENQSKKKPNILILVLEGFSESFIDEDLTPKLLSLSKRSLHYQNFITNQLQTNRGLYALNCGDYPNLRNLESKADMLISGSLQKTCLPRYLKNFEYTNYFIQSAPLSFMRKDLFAKAAGYDFALGANSFSENMYISNWGVGDNTLFSTIPKIIKDHKQKNKDKPYFLSALTVGTHHPYITPMSQGSLAGAVHFTDIIVGKLYEKLKKEDLLKNTLIVITSDESKLLSTKSPLTYSNWGLLLVLGENIKPKKIKTPFSQVDLALSISDFINKGQESPFVGRSIFRNYSSSQGIFFANNFSENIYYLNDKQDLTGCNYQYKCMSLNHYQNPFSKSKKKHDFSNDQKLIYQFVKSNDLSFSNNQLIFQETLPSITSNNYIPFTELKIKGIPGTKLILNLESDINFLTKIFHNHYRCGNTLTMINNEFEYNFKKGLNHIELTLPSDNQIYCNNLVIELKETQRNALKKISLQRRNDK